MKKLYLIISIILLTGLQALAQKLDFAQFKPLLGMVSDKEVLNKIKELQDSTQIHLVPNLHIDDPDALVPYLIELKIQQNQQRIDPYIVLTVNLIPGPEGWEKLSDYKISLSAEASKSLEPLNPVIQLALEKVNVQLQKVDLSKASEVKDAILRFIKYLRVNLLHEMPVDVLFTDKARVDFFAPTDLAGFDNRQYAQLDKYYDKVPTTTKETYYISWLKADDGRQATVKAKIKINDSKINPDSLFFRDVLEKKITGIKEGQNTWSLTFTPSSNPRNYIVAYVPGKDAAGKRVEYPVGMLNVAAYKELTHTVAIVPVNNAKYTFTDLQKELNDIYGKSGVKWTVETKEPLKVDIDFEDKNSPFKIDRSLTSRYSKDMQAVIEAMETKGSDASTYYLFLVSNPDTNITGYMPKNKNYGFIFVDKLSTQPERTVAHELGHGAFRLPHPWDEYGFKGQGETSNLMDYTDSSKLWKVQWDWIHDPGMGIYAFEGTEDAADKIAINVIINIKDAITNLPAKVIKNNCITYLVARSYRISLPVDYHPVFGGFLEGSGAMPEGYLCGFVTKDGESYHSRVRNSKGNYKFFDFVKNNDQEKISFVSKECTIHNNIVLIGLPTEDCKLQLKSAIYTGTTEIKDITPGKLIYPASLENLGAPVSIDENFCVNAGPGRDFFRENFEDAQKFGYLSDLVQIAKAINQQGRKGGTLFYDYATKKKKEWTDFTTFFCYSYKYLVDKKENFENIKNTFNSYIEEYNTLLEKLEESSLGNIELLNYTIQKLSNEQLQTLPLGLRIKCIKVLAEDLTDDHEWLLIRLVEHIKEDEIPFLLEKLTQKDGSNNSLLTTIDKGFADYHDVIKSIDKYSYIIKALYEYYLKVYGEGDEEEIKNLLLKNDFIVWNEDKGYNFDTKFELGEVQINGKSYDPYAKLILQSYTPYSYLDIKVNDTKIIPAFLFHYLSTRRHIEKAHSKAINVTINVVSIASGIGAISTATRVGMALVIADIAISSVDIGAVIFEDNLRKSLGDGIMDAWGYLTIASGLANMGYDFIEDIRFSDALRAKAKTVVDNEAKIIDAVTIAKGEKSAQDVDNFIKTKIAKLLQSEFEINKLDGIASSLLKENKTTFSTISNALNDEQSIWLGETGTILRESPKKFLNETGKNMYDLIIDSKYYVKYNLEDGRILLTGMDGSFYGFAQAMNKPIILAGQNADKIINDHIGTLSKKIIALAVPNGKRSIKLLNKEYFVNPQKVTTIIGNYPNGILPLLMNEVGNFKTLNLGEINGGINILNVPGGYGNSSFWETINKPWLDRAINRGDDIWAASNPMELNLLFKDLSLIPVNSLKTPEALANYLKTLNDPAVLNQITGFGRETQVLSKNGYVFNSSKNLFIK